MDQKTCSVCGDRKPLGEFHNRGGGRSGKVGECKSCHNVRLAAWRRKNPEKNREISMRHYLWKNYRVTLETYNSMLVAQDGRCAICERLPEECGQQRFLHLDHCHETGTVRGLLCKACNHMLGLARDIPNVLRRAADYVERTQSQDAESDYVVEDDALLSILLNPNRTENQTNQK